MPLTIAIGLQKIPISEHSRVKATADTLVIGRSKDCDLTISHPSLSRHHCRLMHIAEVWWVEDMSSSSGTTLNGTLINKRYPLHQMDSIQCGEVLVTILKGASSNRSDSTIHSDQNTGNISSSRRTTVPQQLHTHQDQQNQQEAVSKSRRQAILPRQSGKLLQASNSPLPHAETDATQGKAKRQKVIRPHTSTPAIHPNDPTTVEIMIGDLNYDSHDLNLGSDFYDLSEVDQ